MDRTHAERARLPLWLVLRPLCPSTGKFRHDGRRGARRQLKSLLGRGACRSKEGLAAYRCTWCGSWHIGHSQERIEAEAAREAARSKRKSEAREAGARERESAMTLSGYEEPWDSVSSLQDENARLKRTIASLRAGLMEIDLRLPLLGDVSKALSAKVQQLLGMTEGENR